MRAIIVLAVLGLVFGCANKVEESEKGSDIGWFHGSCVALEGAEPSVGEQVFVIDVVESGEHSEARLGEQLHSGEECPPLLNDRKDVNSGKYRFYRLEAEPSAAEDKLGIAVVVGSESDKSRLDLNNNSAEDHFDYCATSEGIRFYAWDAKTGEKTPFWQGYYYLGYDIEETCEF